MAVRAVGVSGELRGEVRCIDDERQDINAGIDDAIPSRS